MNYAEWVFHNESPIYIQITQKLKSAILSGQLQPGENIPSIREMASTLNINPNTVAKSYRLMCGEGIIESAKGRYCKVVSDKLLIQKKIEQEVQILCSYYLRGMRALGFNKEEALSLIIDHGQI